MADSPLIIIRQLAKQFKGAIRSVTLYDANVCKSFSPSDAPWALTTTRGEPFSKQLRYTYRDRPIRVFANNHFLNATISGSFPIQSFSVNCPNLVFPNFQCATTILVKGKPHPIFTADGSLSDNERHLIQSQAFTAILRDLDLGPDEKLHFTEEDISFYFRESALARVIEALDKITSLAEHIEVPARELDLHALPAQFQPLIPLIRKWAIPDDQEREDFLESLPRQVLRAFLDEVEPHLNSIDSYLDSFGDQPPSEEAAALGRLAECAVEVKRYLESDVNKN